MTHKGNLLQDKYAKLYQILSQNPKITWDELKQQKLVSVVELNDLARRGYIKVKKELSYSLIRPQEDFQELDYVLPEIKEDEMKLKRKKNGFIK